MPVLGRSGTWKRRPVVVVTKNAEIPNETLLAGIACSHSAADLQPRPGDFIELPYDPLSPCASGLKKKTVAICSWLVAIKKISIQKQDFGGVLSSKKLIEIMALLHRT
jgi:hypothetical protein